MRYNERKFCDRCKNLRVCYYSIFNKPLCLNCWKEIKKRTFKRDKVCVYCNNKDELTIDHIIPIYDKVIDDYNNLVIACKKCNCSKGTKDVFKWCKGQNIEVPRIVIDLLNKQKKKNDKNDRYY